MAAPAMPMSVDEADTAQIRWLAKPVHLSRLLVDMEDLIRWQQRSTRGYAAPSEPIGTMTLTDDRSRDGGHSIRLQSPTKLDAPGPEPGRPFGTTTAQRVFDGEDWSEFNRVSFWIYPDLPGFHSISFMVQLRNEGKIKSPGPGRLGTHFLNLNNQQWNHVVWEIPDLPRDQVTGIDFQYRLQGHENGATDLVTFDIDKLELQKVDADYFDGWQVAPDRIAYCQSGYRPQSPKVALAPARLSGKFELVDASSEQAVFKKEAKPIDSHVGEFSVWDFSEFRQPGMYFLRSGEQLTRPFPISDDVWISTAWKSINYFYCQRCGDAIEGIHDVCHEDWRGVHGDKSIVINGGWHDAGDACQGLKNSCDAIVAMLTLAEQLREREENSKLADRLIHEARWGLQYVLKNNFGDGYRVAWATHDYWTNGKLGDADDVTVKARNGPRENFAAAIALTTAYRVLQDDAPEFAKICLQAAKADWHHASQAIQAEENQSLRDFSGIGQATPLDLAAIGVLSSIELFRATGELPYSKLAVQLSGTIVASQCRQYLDGLNTPVAGFFYESPNKQKIYQSHHRGHAHVPIMALATLCATLPDHPDWIRWYSCVAYYAEYLKTIAAYTEPYQVLPASLYRDDQHLQIPVSPPRRFAGYAGATRECFQRQVLAGHDMGGGYYLRRFPVWFTIRGHFGVLLTKTKALSVAARLCGDEQAATLAERQLQWIVGCNPFAQSTMYGEGHDYVPHYSAMSGQIVGSLPVGIETLLDRDQPYWSVHNHMNSKETWVYPVSQWMSVLGEMLAWNQDPALGEQAQLIEASWSQSGQQVTIEIVGQGVSVSELEFRADNVNLEATRRVIDSTDGQCWQTTLRGTVQTSESP